MVPNPERGFHRRATSPWAADMHQFWPKTAQGVAVGRNVSRTWLTAVAQNGINGAGWRGASIVCAAPSCCGVLLPTIPAVPCGSHCKNTWCEVADRCRLSLAVWACNCNRNGLAQQPQI